MSKTTIFLILILFIFVGIFLYVTYANPHNSIMKSLTYPTTSKSLADDTSLSLVSSSSTIQPGQTISVAVLITNQGMLPTLAQLEIAYDPAVLTATSVLPGTFFSHPTIALENINPGTGRISYALKCPVQSGIVLTNCANASANTVATVTFLVNSYATKKQTTITFLPKTLVRSKTGTDILHRTNNLTLTITGTVLPVASQAGQIAPPKP